MKLDPGRKPAAAALLFFALASIQPQTTPPTFYKDVLPILQAHCQSCHRPGQIGPMPLITYGDARAKARSIEQTVRLRKMPPWFAASRYGHFSNDPSLTSQQIDTISAWVRGDTPPGNVRDAPPTKDWIEGWNIVQPDVVVPMPAPVKIPARGDVDYTYEIVPTGFKEDRWVRMSEIRPSSRGTYITPSSIFGRRIPSGCGKRR